jgi:hypothetical protein
MRGLRGGHLPDDNYRAGGEINRGGRGAPNQPSWRFNALAFVDGKVVSDELKDTASSPLKGTDIDMDENEVPNAGSKRNLMNVFISEATGEAVGLGKDNTAPMITEQAESNPNGTIVLTKTKESNKRSKTGADSSSLGSGGSFEELVRSQ